MSICSEHYLDYAATSPIAPGVVEAWTEAVQALAARPGNPAALHGGGRAARQRLEDAREQVASLLGADRAEVVFTSGATEADALAVAGGARGVHAAHPSRERVAVSGVEHDAVLEQAGVLAAAGMSVDVLPVDRDGVAELGALGSWADLALVSMVYAASEVGSLQPVSELAALRPDDCPTLLHTDAAQAVTTCDIHFRTLGVDLLTIGGHKVGAPVGTGALLVRRGTPMVTDRPGGGHERGLRSGTPDVAGAAALAAALTYVVDQRDIARAHAEKLRDYLLRGIAQRCGGLVNPTVAPERAIPTIVHLSLPTRHPEAMLLSMDAAGVHVSAGSACHAGVTRPSAVVVRMGRTEDDALGVLRISTGLGTTEADIDAFLAALPAALEAGQALDRLEVRR